MGNNFFWICALCTALCLVESGKRCAVCQNVQKFNKVQWLNLEWGVQLNLEWGVQWVGSFVFDYREGAPVGGGLVWGSAGERGEAASSIQMRLTHPPAAMVGGRRKIDSTKKRLLFKHSGLWCHSLENLNLWSKLTLCGRQCSRWRFCRTPGLEYGRLSKRGRRRAGRGEGGLNPGSAGWQRNPTV